MLEKKSCKTKKKVKSHYIFSPLYSHNETLQILQGISAIYIIRFSQLNVKYAIPFTLYLKAYKKSQHFCV